MLLLARLGLRSIEVARLELDDLDWRAGELLVRGKGGREDRLPLPDDVGSALAEYLTVRGRREFRQRVLDVAGADASDPCRSRRRCRAAGIAEQAGVAHFGPHRLGTRWRREMLAQGASLQEISQVLRHGISRRPRSTPRSISNGCVRSRCRGQEPTR